MASDNPWWRRRIPCVQQVASTDCGAACLAMVLRLHGRTVSLAEVARAVPPGRDGASALALIEAAATFGLRGRAVRADAETLRFLPRGTVLHWGFTHFVVLERVRRGGVDVVDPAVGRRRVSFREVGQQLTGVALAFERAETFRPGRSRGGGEGWRWYARSLAENGRLLAHVGGASVVVMLFAMTTPLLLTSLVDRVVPHGDGSLLDAIGLSVLALVALHFLSSLLRGSLLLHLRTRLDLTMTQGFLEHLVNLPYSFFQTRSRGDLMLRMNSNAEIRELLTSGALSTVLDGLFVTCYLVVLFGFNAPMAWAALGLGLLQVGILVGASRPQKRLMNRYLAAQSRCNSHQVELLSAIETLKSMGREHRAVEHWSALFVDVLNASVARGRLTTAVESLMGSVRVGAPLCLAWFGAAQVVAGRLELGTMLAVVSLAMGFLTPLFALVGTGLRLSLLASYVDRIDDVLATEPESAGTLPAAPRAPLQGAITLDGVSFRYSDDGPLILRDLRVEVPAGRFVAVVGPSGAGKSTLARLLVGLHRPTEGRILYDGIDLSGEEPRAIRRQLGIVTQIPQLFGLTVRANIALSDPSVPHEQVMEAARLARIHDDIAAMPMGYDTNVADGGLSLSGGQRQRIALARALIHKPAILVLDEATSALDTVTEKAIQEELARLRCTRLVIAHRLSTISAADHILVVDHGRVVEQGTHEQLLAQGGAYSRLVASQILTAPAAAASGERPVARPS